MFHADGQTQRDRRDEPNSRYSQFFGWILLAQDKLQCQAVVKKNCCRVAYKTGLFLSS